MALPFAEKYRPKTFQEVISHESMVLSISSMVRSNSLQNILFYGPPGTGKTTTAMVIAHEMYGTSWAVKTKILNASDERGINVIRNEVKGFCGMGVGLLADGEEGSRNEKQPKLVILDEADMLSKPAQYALRRIMEDFSESVRFLILCNYVQKVIAPIQSRCAVYRLSGLSTRDVVQAINRVCALEKLRIDDCAAIAIAEVCKGDMRKVLNLLQNSMMLRELGSDDPIKEADVLAFMGRPTDAHADEIMDCLTQMGFARCFKRIKEIISECHYTIPALTEAIYAKVQKLDIPLGMRFPIVTTLADVENACAMDSYEPDFCLATIIGAFIRARARGGQLYSRILKDFEYNKRDTQMEDKMRDRELAERAANDPDYEFKVGIAYDQDKDVPSEGEFQALLKDGSPVIDSQLDMEGWRRMGDQLIEGMPSVEAADLGDDSLDMFSNLDLDPLTSGLPLSPSAPKVPEKKTQEKKPRGIFDDSQDDEMEL